MWRLITNEIVDCICIIMLILGSIGNSLGLIVFSSRKFRRTTYGRLAIASLIINLLCVYRYSLLLHSNTRRWIKYKAGQSWFNCKLYRLSSCLRIISAVVTVVWTYERFSYVTRNVQLFRQNRLFEKCKYYLITIFSLIIVTILTGPTVYFYETNFERKIHLNSTLNKKENLTMNENELIMSCILKKSINQFWYSFLNDVRFGLNYTTLRSIFSEIIPSLLVIYFNIGLIIRVIQSSISFSSNGSTTNIRQSNQNSFLKREGNDGLIVHNRPRTSWMNIVLILHSCLFFFSSLTASIVHWTTSHPLLSHWISVVILANYSLNFYIYCLSGKSFRNEIRRLFSQYFQYYCFVKCLNLFRTKSQRQQVKQTLRMNSVRLTANYLFPASSQTRSPSFIQRNHS